MHNNIISYENLYDDEIMASLYEVSKHLFMPPSSFFIGFEEYFTNKARKLLSEYFPAPFVEFLYDHLNTIIVKTNIIRDGRYGFEIWIGNSSSKSKTSGYLHVDNDEFYRMKYNITKTPIWGSILYITPKNTMVGGETIVLNENPDNLLLFTTYEKNFLLDIPNSFVCEPVTGKLLLFRGDLPHAVLPFNLRNARDTRINLMVNIWEERIFSVPEGITFFNKDSNGCNH